MTKETYDVIRTHTGDRKYRVGEQREADPTSVKHLIGKVLVPVGGGKKKADPVSNKKAPDPENKGLPGLPQPKK